MAKMFPNSFPEESLSSGEKKVFEHLKNNAPADWMVLHSFRLPKHPTVVFGEADFIVIAPKFGIFVLEIKSGGVGFNGSEWVFINRNHEMSYKKRGPFQQGREAMFSVEKILLEKLGRGFGRTDILYGYGVIFTDESNFPTNTITEDETWRLYQKTDQLDYTGFIKKLKKNFIDELLLLGKAIPSELSVDDANRIAKALRPSIDCVVPLKSFSKATEDEIISLTEEQYSCLDDIEINERMVVTGGAGTGKTLIAVEEARRCSANEKVAFFCYNKNLADFIKNNLQREEIVVYSLHSYMTKICGEQINEFEKSDEFFLEILPQLAIDAAKDKGILFDRIIVDEFQDVCIREYLLFFDIILKNGLMDGAFTFYGDFARQAIYHEGASLKVLKDFTYYARKHLSINCRNTRYIGNELVNITGYDDKHYLLKITGEPVDYYVWDTEEEQSKKLSECIKELKKKGFKASSIMILSPKKRERSVVNYFDKDEFIIGNYGKDSDAYLAMYSTVHAYKGLESEIVILSDVEDYSDISIMYIALSRARSKLIVLESTKASEQRKKRIVAR